MADWPNQIRAAEAEEMLRAPGKAVCVTSPTGTGKGRCIENAVDRGLERRNRVVIYTNRKLLREQQERRFDSAGIRYGVRAAGVEPRLLEDVQISSIQTEASRVYRREDWELHNAHLAIVDEAHMHGTGVSQATIQKHKEDGAYVLGYTATPIEVNHLYDELVVAGTKKEGREVGSLLPAHVYGCGELDTDKIKRTATGEFSIAEIRKKVWTQKIFGRVISEFRRLNPDHLPTLGCAPGVKESIWLAERCTEAGIRSAHIDGDDCWIDGEFFKSDQDVRDRVIAMSEAGEIKIIWNRFVMREGVDLPWLKHLILATPIGSFVSYLQTVGRVLRFWPNYEFVTIQDHGGNYWRHGSPNADTDWHALWTTPCKTITDLRLSRIREKGEAQPIECPQCGAIRLAGPKCSRCGFTHTHRTRMVIQADGSLKHLTVRELKARHRKHKPTDENDWRSMYFRACRKGMTFAQAEALFAKEHSWRYPVRELPLMPVNDRDWYRPVKDVPKGDLR